MTLAIGIAIGLIVGAIVGLFIGLERQGKRHAHAETQEKVDVLVRSDPNDPKSPRRSTKSPRPCARPRKVRPMLSKSSPPPNRMPSAAARWCDKPSKL